MADIHPSPKLKGLEMLVFCETLQISVLERERERDGGGGVEKGRESGKS